MRRFDIYTSKRRNYVITKLDKEKTIRLIKGKIPENSKRNHIVKKRFNHSFYTRKPNFVKQYYRRSRSC